MLRPKIRTLIQREENFLFLVNHLTLSGPVLWQLFFLTYRFIFTLDELQSKLLEKTWKDKSASFDNSRAHLEYML